MSTFFKLSSVICVKIAVAGEYPDHEHNVHTHTAATLSDRLRSARRYSTEKPKWQTCQLPKANTYNFQCEYTASILIIILRFSCISITNVQNEIEMFLTPMLVLMLFLHLINMQYVHREDGPAAAGGIVTSRSRYSSERKFVKILDYNIINYNFHYLFILGINVIFIIH